MADSRVPSLERPFFAINKFWSGKAPRLHPTLYLSGYSKGEFNESNRRESGPK